MKSNNICDLALAIFLLSTAYFAALLARLQMDIHNICPYSVSIAVDDKIEKLFNRNTTTPSEAVYEFNDTTRNELNFQVGIVV